MMAAVACAAVPKITIVIGGCYGSESYVMVWVAQTLLGLVTGWFTLYQDCTALRL